MISENIFLKYRAATILLVVDVKNGILLKRVVGIATSLFAFSAQRCI